MIWGPGLPGPQGVAGATGPQGPAGAAGAAGKVLQVVHASTTTEVTVSGTTAFTDSTLAATITPSSTSSKIFVLVSQQVHGAFSAAGTTTTTGTGSIQLVRDSSVIWQTRETANGPVAWNVGITMSSATLTNLSSSQQFPLVILDSPGTASPITYKTQIRALGTNHTAIAQFSGSVRNGRSDIILMEIAA